jgi:hypothetical protein
VKIELNNCVSYRNAATEKHGVSLADGPYSDSCRKFPHIVPVQTDYYPFQQH